MKQKNRMAKHHIIPRSRGGLDSLENMIEVPERSHEHYHALFGNRTPVEIIDFLVVDYWGCNYQLVKKAYMRYRKGEYDMGL